MSAIYETAVQPARGATARDAHLIASDAEAIDAARALAARLAEGAAERDRERRLPYEEID
ncbi:SfnB family sulfur acquisition oxidoreductase, partial [Burkholderia pseudomallei]